MADLMKGSYTYEELANKYGNFFVPAVRLYVNGKEVSQDVTRHITAVQVSLSLSAAGAAVVHFAGIYDRQKRTFDSDVKSKFKLGTIVEVGLGYGSEVTKVLKGFVALLRADFQEDPGIVVTIMDVRRLMMTSGVSEVLHEAKNYSDVVKKILDADGGTVENIGATLVRQTVSEKTSSLIRQYLYHTMYGEADSNGNNATGRNARVAGYAMGGKTGTAQKIPRSDRKYLVSFIGFAPVDNPQVVCYVVVDEPNAADATAQASSSFAQEIFKNIMTEAMPYLNIYATEEIPADMQDEVDAQKAAEEESGSTEEGTEEETAEEELPEGTLIDPNTGETVTMPTEEELESEDAGDMMGGIDSPILPADGSEADTGEEDASQ